MRHLHRRLPLQGDRRLHRLVKRTRRNDLLLILGALLLAAALLFVLRLTRRTGGEAVVSIGGAEYCRLPLTIDAELTLPCGNTVTVRGGAVCVSDADCPDRVCVRTGWVRADGETIVCLPHRLVVEVAGGAARGTDAETG